MKYAISKKDFNIIKIEDNQQDSIDKENYHIVDTPEEADEYVWQNKPCMSYEDVYEWMEGCEKLEYFVKSKLKNS